MGISGRIKQLRSHLGLSQAVFAGRLGYTYAAVQKWERGQPISEASLKLIEQSFDVNPSWLREGEGEMFAARDESPSASMDSRDALIINALKSGLVSDADKDFIMKYIAERRELSELRQAQEKKKKTG